MRLLSILVIWMISAAIITAQTPVVRSIQFRGFPASIKEILKTLKDKGVKLAVEDVRRRPAAAPGSERRD